MCKCSNLRAASREILGLFSRDVPPEGELTLLPGKLLKGEALGLCVERVRREMPLAE